MPLFRNCHLVKSLFVSHISDWLLNIGTRDLLHTLLCPLHFAPITFTCHKGHSPRNKLSRVSLSGVNTYKLSRCTYSCSIVQLQFNRWKLVIIFLNQTLIQLSSHRYILQINKCVLQWPSSCTVFKYLEHHSWQKKVERQFGFPGFMSSPFCISVSKLYQKVALFTSLSLFGSSSHDQIII